jgi:hypothetical protein
LSLILQNRKNTKKRRKPVGGTETNTRVCDFSFLSSLLFTLLFFSFLFFSFFFASLASLLPLRHITHTAKTATIAKAFPLVDKATALL